MKIFFDFIFLKKNFKKKLAETDLNGLSSSSSSSSSLALSQTLNNLQLFLNNNINPTNGYTSALASSSSDAFEIAIPLTFNTNFNDTSMSMDHNLMTNGQTSKTIRQLSDEQNQKITFKPEPIEFYAPVEYHNQMSSSLLTKELNQNNFSNEVEPKSSDFQIFITQEKPSKIKVPGARKLKIVKNFHMQKNKIFNFIIFMIFVI